MDNIIILGNFNCETNEPVVKDFCDIYSLKNLITEPTWFKSIVNPSSIDLILTNRSQSFQNSQVVETGLSDHHKMTVTVLRTFCPKQSPIRINYRDYKHFDREIFRIALIHELQKIGMQNITYDIFEATFMELLNRYAPMKIKYIRANNAPFMTKLLSKAIMNRSRLKNKFIKDPSKDNEHKYKKQRNYCVNLVKREEKNYYDNLDIRRITDNKQFWKTLKPLFSDQHTISKTITLVEGENIISDDSEVAEIMNNFFSNGVDKLNIQGFIGKISDNDYLDPVSNAINIFRDHPSIIKIKGKVRIEKQFSFNFPEEAKIKQIISQLNTKKPTTFNNIPAKILVENYDIVHSLFPKFLMTL